MKMRLKNLVGATMFTGIMLAGAAHADGVFSGSVALTTDYVFRGITQSRSDPAIQGSFDYTNGSFYAGVWGSSINFGGDESLEADVYSGFRPSLGPVAFDLGVIGYFYPGAADDAAELDYIEAKLGASITPVEHLTLGATAYFSPDFTGETGEALYTEASAAYAFTEAFSVSGALGNQEIDEAVDYSTWNAGASFTAHGFKFDVRYYETDLDAVDEVVNFSISRTR